MSLNTRLCGFLVILLLYNEISALNDNKQLIQTDEEDANKNTKTLLTNSETVVTLERPITPTRDWRNLDEPNSFEQLFKLHIKNIKMHYGINNQKTLEQSEHTGIKPTGWWNYPHENYHNGDEVDLPETIKNDDDQKLF